LHCDPLHLRPQNSRVARRCRDVGLLGELLRGLRIAQMFRFAIIDADESECLGVVAYARDSEPGDVIPQGAAGDLRVVKVLEAEREDRLPVLVVERAD
jgi:hypothetical protein